MTSLKSSILSPFYRDRYFLIFLKAMALLSGAIAGFIILFLVIESFPYISKYGFASVFSGSTWSPMDGEYNLGPMLVGSLLVMVGAVLLALPFGIAAAIFCHFYAPPIVGAAYRRMIQLLAGIPSVVFGFWGLVELVPLIRHYQAPGSSLFAGILLVGLMILPTMALIIDGRLQNIPEDYFTGAMALGLSRKTTIIKVLFPEALSAILTASSLSAGRAIGETMAVIMVCGNIVQVPGSLFDPVRTLTANIALEMAYAIGDHRAILFVTGLLLTFIVLILVILGGFFQRDLARA